MDSLLALVRLGNASDRGIRVRFGHPNASDDGLGKYLGRSKNFRLDGNKVRADMYLNETSLEEPPQGGRPLGEYVMHLGETDPGAFSSSVVIQADKEPIDGQPPVFHPTHLYASDVVDTGDAVDDFLSSDFLEDLPQGVVHQATALIDEQFAGQSRDVVEARLRAFLSKYLDHKFGPEDEDINPEEEHMSDTANDARIAKLEEQQAAMTEQLGGLTEGINGLTDQLKADREAAKAKEASSERASKITSLCAMVGVDSQQATEWIADESLSVDDVKDKLLKIKIEKSQLAGGAGPEGGNKDEKYSREYDEHKKDHMALGITREAYIKARKEVEGDSDEFAYMSPEWAEKQREELLKSI